LVQWRFAERCLGKHKPTNEMVRRLIPPLC
jgi:hypothetical protein